MRALLGTGLAACLALAALRPAYAISDDHRESLEKYFRGKGDVRYELYTPFGGPEVGVAVYESAGQPRLEAALVSGKGKGTTTTLMSEVLGTMPARAPFTFLLSGKHLLTYSAKPFTDAYGVPGQIGSLSIRDLSEGAGAKVLLELRDVANLQFQPGTDAYGESIIWQSKPCFLNSGGRLPVKHSYARLDWNDEKQQYELHDALAALPGADKDESANANNRAIIHYRLGRLQDASNLLNEAVISAESNQSIVLRNKAIVDGEIEDFARQSKVDDRPFDDALMYYFQGDFKGCIRVLTARQSSGLGPIDAAMFGLALAQEREWPRADRFTEQLMQQQVPFLTEYLGDLVEIARYQGFPDIAATQLKKLESVDAGSPDFAAELATLMIETGDTSGAETVLERCVNSHHVNTSSMSAPRRVLYGLYLNRGNISGCQNLIRDAISPLLDLSGYAGLLDYKDLSEAMKPVEMDHSDRLASPATPLDRIVLPDE